MIFYKIKFKSFPKIEFASTVSTKKYKINVTPKKRTIELAIFEGGDISVFSNDKNYIKKSGSFTLRMPDTCRTQQVIGEEQIYLSFAAVIGDFEYERIDSENIEDMSEFIDENNDLVFLPEFITLDTEYNEIDRMFRLLIFSYLKETAEGNIYAISVFFNIIASVSEIFKKTIKNQNKLCFGEYYSRKVKRYIEEHYKEKIKVNDIANSLGITPNYLSSVFKSSTGKSITEFINLTRLYHARRLAYDGKLTFKEIAKEVGISDIYYLNRLFHKYYGVSLYDCGVADREISLYHDKPWKD